MCAGVFVWMVFTWHDSPNQTLCLCLHQQDHHQHESHIKYKWDNMQFKILRATTGHYMTKQQQRSNNEEKISPRVFN